MKSILILVATLTMLAIVFAGDQKPKQFEVTFTIMYNSLTLEQAAKKEVVIRELFKDACFIDVKMADVHGGTVGWIQFDTLSNSRSYRFMDSIRILAR